VRVKEPPYSCPWHRGQPDEVRTERSLCDCSHSPNMVTGCPRLAKLKNQQRAGLRNHRFSRPYLVDSVLHALGIKSPTRVDSDVLLAIDFK
jgi:hypothetical protein